MNKLRKAAEGTPCLRCGNDDGTVVLCHYSGPWQHKFGKGRGIKGNDLAGAHLCYKCHAFFDEYKSKNIAGMVERSEEFLALCLLTVIRLYEKGVIK